MKRTLQIIVFLAIFGVSAQIAYSCSCFRIDNQAEIEMTGFIFVGKAVEIIEDKSYVPPKVEGASEFLQIMLDTRKRYLVKFKVEKKFKGVEDDEITLVKYVQDSMCADTSFEKEKTYLIYADQNKDSRELSDNGWCSRTQKFDKTSKDYKELLKLKNNNRIEQKKT